MRSVVVSLSLALTLSSSLAAQDSTKTPRFALAAGPSWDFLLTGVRVRAEHHLIRDRWFGVRLEAGGLWTPTQYFERNLFGDVRGVPSYWGWGQAVDFRVGAAAMLSPLPRGRFSPYVIGSLAAVQRWWSGVTYARRSSNDPVQPVAGSSTRGEVVGGVGLGIQARFGGRAFRLELRREGVQQDLTLGTALRF